MPARPRKPRAAKTTTESCPLTSNPSLRLTVNGETDSIKDHFPKGISRPALRALHVAGYRSLEQLTQITEGEFVKLHGIGPKAIEILRAALHTQGLDFRS